MARGCRRVRRARQNNRARKWRLRANKGKALKGPARQSGTGVAAYRKSLSEVVKQRHANPRGIHGSSKRMSFGCDFDPPPRSWGGWIGGARPESFASIKRAVQQGLPLVF
jgi:hypothetical protein